MRKHPLSAYIYIWTIDFIAITLFTYSLFKLPSYEFLTWISFGIWTIILSYARLGGFFKLIDSDTLSGWATCIEIAVAIILPFPLFCISMFISTSLIITNRIRNKHPKPFFGPDFNASNNILSTYALKLSYNKISLLIGNIIAFSVIPLLISIIIYAIVQTIFLTTLISIDSKKHWLKVGTLNFDSMISELLLVITGALLGRVYQLDPSLIILMLIPVLLLHNTLDKANKSKLVYIDDKTKLYNYRYFDEKINELFNKASEKSSNLSIVFSDMDYLREVNNTYGHAAGDKALISISNVLKENCKENEIAVRFGGEEFVLILPNYNKEQATKIAEKIRCDIEKTEILIDDDKHINVTMSLGVSTYPDDVNSMEELIKSADDALYIAKNSGRNRVVLSSNNPSKKLKEVAIDSENN